MNFRNSFCRNRTTADRRRHRWFPCIQARLILRRIRQRCKPIGDRGCHVVIAFHHGGRKEQTRVGMVSNSALVDSSGKDAGSVIIRMPNRSRTVLRYSIRFSRRTGVPPTLACRSACVERSARSSQETLSRSPAEGCCSPSQAACLHLGDILTDEFPLLTRFRFGELPRQRIECGNLPLATSHRDTRCSTVEQTRRPIPEFRPRKPTTSRL